MAIWKYTAIDESGDTITGNVNAEHDVEAISKIENLGFEPVSVVKQKTSRFGRKINRKDLINFTYQLYQLLKAGVPLITALESVHETMEDNRAFQAVISDIIDQIRTGSTLHDAMEDHKNVFPMVYRALVLVGEDTGNLEHIFEKLHDQLVWQEDLLSKSKKMAVYPTIVLIVISLVVSVLMVKVVPKLVSFIKLMGNELSFATTSLIATSNFIVSYWPYLLSIPFVLFFVIKFMIKNNEKFAKWWDCSLYKIPLLGKIRHRLKLANMASSLNIMYSSGMSFTDALDLSSKVLNSPCLMHKIENAVNMIRNGVDISDAFQRNSIFPNMAIHMMRSGESSGKIDESLHTISVMFDKEAKGLIEKIEPAIEPILTVVLAFIVMWIMSAVLVPVYDTISKIQM